EKQPDFKNSLKTKDNILAEWLMEWIDTRFIQGRLKVNDLLPAKKLLSEKTKVSIGTVQTAIRIIEDCGYVASKQRIGTFILDRSIVSAIPRKQTSKREQTIENLKKFIVNQKYQTGDILPSSRELSKTIGSAPNTTRLALEYLAKNGTIQSKTCRGNKSNWIIKIIPEIIDNTPENENLLESDTLVNKIERDLKELISKNYKVGDKLISHYELTDILKVSIKTIHDAMKRLVEQGILQSKRGRYGTYILRMPSDKQIMTGKESEIFAPAVEASLYNYERVESYLKEFIKQNYKVGDKLPAMGKLAVEFNVSSNTIRKALQQLAEKDIVIFSRGRYGGTFLVKTPDEQPA
ncbi:MAG: GntR family transcriptional regulator, partial [Candidatus Aenigmarchaeota archaeon]|nr:GntR family transcriptional regulator [Candidatus Aenigmarchaeota archaeon]